MAIVEVYLDLTDPHSYLASTQIERIAAGTGAVFRWYPVAASELLERGQEPYFRSHGPFDPEFQRNDVEAWAAYYQVPLRDPPSRQKPDPAFLAGAAIAAGGSEERGAMVKRLFAALFVEMRTKVDSTDLFNFAADVGLDPWAYRNALIDPMVAAERIAIVERAKAFGVFGVPFCVTRDKKFFGHERMLLLAQHLLENPEL